MIFSWLRNRRRRKLLGESFPDAWEACLCENIKHFPRLSDPQQQRIRECVQVMVAEKNWEAVRGFNVTDEMKVTIAGTAALLVLGMPDYYFDKQRTIIVQPDAYRPGRPHSRDGWVDENQKMEGEAYQFGPIVLSWQDVLAGSRDHDDGHNLVLHEFAHFLDGADGGMGGTPPLTDRRFADRWEAVMGREFESLCWAVEFGRWTLLDHYGATNRAEFFAVATETFFERPTDLHEEHAELYDLLREFYQVNPAGWAT